MELEDYMATFIKLRHDMGSDDHKLTDSGGISILKKHLKHIPDLKATFAVWSASGSNELDKLVRTIKLLVAESKAEIESKQVTASRSCCWLEDQSTGC